MGSMVPMNTERKPLLVNLAINPTPGEHPTVFVHKGVCMMLSLSAKFDHSLVLMPLYAKDGLVDKGGSLLILMVELIRSYPIKEIQKKQGPKQWNCCFRLSPSSVVCWGSLASRAREMRMSISMQLHFWFPNVVGLQDKLPDANTAGDRVVKKSVLSEQVKKRLREELLRDDYKLYERAKELEKGMLVKVSQSYNL